LKHLPLFICTGLSLLGGNGELAALLISVIGAGEAIVEVGALLHANILGSSGEGLRRCFLDFSIAGIIVVSSIEVEGDFTVTGFSGFLFVVVIVVVGVDDEVFLLFVVL
jgi:hypothetical protein